MRMRIKNDRWQPYAAATAAAYAKELLGVLDGGEVESTRRVADVLDGSMQIAAKFLQPRSYQYAS